MQLQKEFGYNLFAKRRTRPTHTSTLTTMPTSGKNTSRFMKENSVTRKNNGGVFRNLLLEEGGTLFLES